MNGDDPRYLGSSKPSFDWSKLNWAALFFLVLGIVWLLQSVGVASLDWSRIGPILGPVALVFTSLMLILQRTR